MRKGHQGHNMYFIFSGAVAVSFGPNENSIFVKNEDIVLTKGDSFGVSNTTAYNLILFIKNKHGPIELYYLMCSPRQRAQRGLRIDN